MYRRKYRARITERTLECFQSIHRPVWGKVLSRAATDLQMVCFGMHVLPVCERDNGQCFAKPLFWTLELYSWAFPWACKPNTDLTISRVPSKFLVGWGLRSVVAISESVFERSIFWRMWFSPKPFCILQLYLFSIYFQGYAFCRRPLLAPRIAI